MKEIEKQGMPKVYFVGAGPGDPELITVKGQEIDRGSRPYHIRRISGKP